MPKRVPQKKHDYFEKKAHEPITLDYRFLEKRESYKAFRKKRWLKYSECNIFNDQFHKKKHKYKSSRHFYMKRKKSIFHCCHCFHRERDLIYLLQHVEHHKSVNPPHVFYKSTRDKVRQKLNYIQKNYFMDSFNLQNSLELPKSEKINNIPVSNESGQFNNSIKNNDSTVPTKTPYFCTRCESNILTECAMQLHLFQKNHNQVLIYCLDCYEDLLTMDVFENLNKGTVYEKVELKFLCLKCNRDFENMNILEQHIQNFHYAKCSTCKTLFISRNALKRHLKDVNNHNSKSSKTKCRTKKCICNKLFASEDDLKQHMTHVEHHICQVCNKTFKTSDSLKKHLDRKSHQGLNFEGYVQGIEGGNKDYMSYINQYIESKYGSINRNDFICPFTLNDALNHSIRSTRRKAYMYACQECKSTFKTAAALKQHSESSVHRRKNCICLQCKVPFLSAYEVDLCKNCTTLSTKTSKEKPRQMCSGCNQIVLGSFKLHLSGAAHKNAMFWSRFNFNRRNEPQQPIFTVINTNVSVNPLKNLPACSSNHIKSAFDGPSTSIINTNVNVNPLKKLPASSSNHIESAFDSPSTSIKYDSILSNIRRSITEKCIVSNTKSKNRKKYNTTANCPKKSNFICWKCKAQFTKKKYLEVHMRTGMPCFNAFS